MQGWKLTKKFLVSILLVLAAVMTIMVVVLSIHQKGVLIRELNNKGKNTTEFLAGISAEPILSYNFEFLENYVRDAARDRDLVYAVILDMKGNPLTTMKEEPKDKTGIPEFTARVMHNNDQIGIVKKQHIPCEVSSIEEMIASIKQVSENTDTLSESAEQTSSSITEMSSSVKEVEQRAISPRTWRGQSKRQRRNRPRAWRRSPRPPSAYRVGSSR